ncbi:MAG: TIGR02453 family protein [Ectothiorhodospiraceae bacterium]|nr:TIGR02453 family protein [Ectothiorhodospiraceae bacterium]
MSAKKVEGFPKEAVAFLAKLGKNNDKNWFLDHRDEFEEKLMEPAREFVTAVGDELKKVRPDIIADPKTDKSIFRLHRDVRFSKDKSPYKTNLGILFWEGEAKKMENPGFYMHFEPKTFFAGVGMHIFTKDQLKIYRDVVSQTGPNKELADAAKKVTKKGYEIWGKHYKQVPRGYSDDIPNAEYLLHNGIMAGITVDNVKELYEQDMKKYAVKLFKDMLPIHEWCLKYIVQG